MIFIKCNIVIVLCSKEKKISYEPNPLYDLI